MKILCLVYLVTFMGISAHGAELKISCAPTVGYGDVNFQDPVTGLNRIRTLEITRCESGWGGEGIRLLITGTSGTGTTSVTSTMALPWSSSYGAFVNTYSNMYDQNRNPLSPVVKFEIERTDKQNTYLGVLTVIVMRNSKMAELLTSRFNCRLTR